MFCIQCLLYFVCFVAIHGKFEYPIINIGEVSLSPTASSTWKGYNVFATYSYEDGETIDLTCHHPRSKLLLAYTSTEGAESVYVNDYNIVNFMKRMTPNNHREHIDCCLIVWKIDHFFCQVIYRVVFELKRNFTEYARISIGGVDLVPTVKSTVGPLYVTASYFFWDGEIIDLTCYYPGENLTLKYFFTSVISTVNARSTVNFLTRMSSNDSKHIISCASRLFTYTVSFRLKETPAYNVTESDSSMTTEYAKSPNDESKDKHRGEDGVMIVVGCVIAIVLFLGVISIFIIKRCYKKINIAVKAQDDYVEPETFLNSRLPGSDSTYANISSSAPPMLNTNLFNEEMYAQPLKKSER